MKKAFRALLRGLSGQTGVRKNSKDKLVGHFHQLYYNMGAFGGTWKDTRWLGIPTAKCPLDLWIYQEILFELRPDLIVETGTFRGGSALYLASICDILKQGRILTVDVERSDERPEHPRIQYLHGSSVSPEILQRIQQQIRPADKVMVALDSDHSTPHVLAELRAYSKLVTRGSYIVVEDSNVNGHPVYPGHGPGPMEAIDEFLGGNDDFVVDESREKFLLTFNPRGFLRRMK